MFAATAMTVLGSFLLVGACRALRNREPLWEAAGFLILGVALIAGATVSLSISYPWLFQIGGTR